MDRLRYLNLEKTGKAEIPKGLEERLLIKIEQWAEEEEKDKALHTEPTKLPKSKAGGFHNARFISAAACITLIAGLMALLPRLKTNKAQQDTFDDPELARIEVMKAFQLLEYNINIGIKHLELAEEIKNETNKTLNNALKELE